MMIISSTEFQQNVGHYLKEAQKGKTIQISKSKPEKAMFTISYQKENSIDNSNKVSRNKKILDLIKKLDIHNSKESGLEFQRRVRS